MQLQNLLSVFSDTFTKIKDFVNTLIVFLTSYTGSETIAYATVGIVGFLGVALIFFLLLAILSPSKRKLKKLKKSLKDQAEYDKLRQRLYQISEEMGAINLEVKFIERQCIEDTFNLTEIERSAAEQDELFILNIKRQINDISDKKAVLQEALNKHNKGFLKSAKKEKVESAQLLINDLIEQKERCLDEIAKKTAEIEKRKSQHAKDIETLKNGLELKRKEFSAKKVALELEKAQIEEKIEKFENTGNHKLTLSDAIAMTDEFAKQKKLADKELEEKALEELRIAKARYEDAYKKRIKAEKDKEIAVENVKLLQKQKEKVTTLKTVKYSPVTVATAVRSTEKPDDVNIIIADIDSGILFSNTQEVESTPKTTVDEHSYQEPIVEVVNLDNLPEEEVVFVEAFLDYLNSEADDETLLDETAITEETSIAFENKEFKDDTPIVEVTTTESTPEQAVEDLAQAEEILQTATENVQAEYSKYEEILEEIMAVAEEETQQEEPLEEILPTEEVVEETETQVAAEEKTEETIEEVAITTPIQVEPIEVIKPVKYPAYKDYNDGIPATPIYKTSKFQKPVTKLVKKNKPTESANIQQEPTTTKINYSGKWQIEENDNKFYAKLIASNGGVLLTTPSYSSVNGVKGCIESVKTALSSDSVVILNDKDGKFFFKVLSPSKRTILQGSKYSTKYQCEKSIASAKSFAQKAIIR